MEDFESNFSEVENLSKAFQQFNKLIDQRRSHFIKLVCTERLKVVEFTKSFIAFFDKSAILKVENLEKSFFLFKQRYWNLIMQTKNIDKSITKINEQDLVEEIQKITEKLKGIQKMNKDEFQLNNNLLDLPSKIIPSFEKWM